MRDSAASTPLNPDGDNDSAQTLSTSATNRTSAQPNALLAAISECIDTHTGAGARLDGRPLAPPDTAYTVRDRDGRISRGSRHRNGSMEQICAYELCSCQSIEEAVELASRHPMAAVATIEVRPVWGERLRAKD